MTEEAFGTTVAVQNQQFHIRHCHGPAELEQCVVLAQQIWGYPDREAVPRNIFVLAQALGGHVLGAWSETGLLAGFAMALAAHEPCSLPGLEKGNPPAPVPYLHSHMLAVRPEFRNRGLGFALKRAQREDALRRGIVRIRWTPDPLAARNAWFNLEKLGATARRYLPDFYGPIESTLQGRLPTDRLLAEWELLSGRVSAAVTQGFQEPIEPPEPARVTALPGEWARWRAGGERDLLLRAQQELREQCLDAFVQGLYLGGFRATPDGGGAYLFFRPEHEAS